MGITQGMGARVQRVEDPRYLRGRTRFLDTLNLPGMLTAAFVRSTDAHARVGRIDTSDAAALPGVHRVLTGEAVNAWCRPIRADRETPGPRGTHYAPTDCPVMAGDTVRFVGEILAVVVADDRYVAEDAVEAVLVETDPLPVVADIAAALAPDAPLVHAELADNRHFHSRIESGDVEAAFASADAVVRTEFRTNRHCASPVETRAVLAHTDPVEGRLVVYTSSQMPHLVRTKLADWLSYPERLIRVVAPDVGGGFGLKCHVFPEELIVSALALRLGCPVKWVEDRAENYLAGFHAKEERIDFALAVRADGTILAVDAKFEADGGAYTAFPWTPTAEPAMAASACTGPYRIAALRSEAVAVYTNKSTQSVCRGVGLPIANYALEHSIDRAAARLGLDAAELRRRNLLRRDEFPYRTPAWTVYDSGSPLESLQHALELVDYPALRARQREARAAGQYLGIGISSMIETTTYGRDVLAPAGKSDNVALHEAAAIEVDPNGGVTLRVGTHSHGQSHATTYAQLIAGELGCDVEAVRFVQGDTDATPYGSGTWGSRSAVAAGGAVLQAARSVRAKATQVAAHLLQVRAEDIERTADGAFAVAAGPERRVTLAEVARAAVLETNLPLDLPAGLSATADHSPRSPYTVATHVAVVEVDPDTCGVTLLDYGVCEDCGPMINPMVVEGQIVGGVVQGIGSALFEHHVYDAHGQLATASMMDYLLPTAPGLPRVRMTHMETPSPHSQEGIKGMGEGGAVAPLGAIPNAVSDALRGIVGEWRPITALPITPLRIYELLRDAHAGAEAGA